MKRGKLYVFYCIVFLLQACTKYLEPTPDNSLVTPANIQDARALLDTYTNINGSYSSLPHSSNDDFYITESNLLSVSQQAREIYIWDIKQASMVRTAWSTHYTRINRVNLVIDFLKEYSPTESEKTDYNECLGLAHYLRAYNHFLLAQLFAQPYHPQDAAQTPGIPIRQRADIAEKTTRGTLQQTYEFLLSDLEKAILLLPGQPSLPFRPSGAAAWSLKAYVLLHMFKFEGALEAAEHSLKLNNVLMDYTLVDTTASTSFQRYNKEVLFQGQVSGSDLLGFNIWRIDTLLYKLYGPGDLRRPVFFRSNGAGSFGFKGDLGGENNYDVFAGVSTGETYLLCAEAAARTGKIALAMDRLNALLVKRYKPGTFVPYAADSREQAFEMVMTERRKELVARGLRWFDVRRWNREGIRNISMRRFVNGAYITLPPNDARYVFEIPDDVVASSGIEQNPR